MTDKRRISARRVLLVAVVLVTAATALVIAVRPGARATPRTGDGGRSTVTFVTPGRRRVTVTARATKRGTARWCVTVTVRARRDRTATSNGACGNGTSDGFHGAYIADCAAREIAVIGLLAPDIAVSQPHGLPASQQTHYLAPPPGSHLHGRFYALIATLTARPIQAMRAGVVIRGLAVPAFANRASRQDTLPFGDF